MQSFYYLLEEADYQQIWKMEAIESEIIIISSVSVPEGNEKTQ